MRTPRPGGKGSNQYATKPAAPTTEPRSNSSIVVPADDSDPEEVAWQFDPDRKPWADAGFPTWHETQQWRTRGYTPTEAADWVGEGFDADTAMHWQTFYPPKTAGNWREFFATPTEADQWRQAGFLSSDANRWHRNFGPEDAKAWHNAGFRHTEAARSVEQGYPDPGAVLEHAAALGIENYTTHWLNFWFLPREARAWRDAGVTSAMDAKEWKQRGFTATDAAGWVACAFSAKSAQTWRGNGYSAQGAKDRFGAS